MTQLSKHYSLLLLITLLISPLAARSESILRIPVSVNIAGIERHFYREISDTLPLQIDYKKRVIGIPSEYQLSVGLDGETTVSTFEQNIVFSIPLKLNGQIKNKLGRASLRGGRLILSISFAPEISNEWSIDPNVVF
jgi:hypothetical protein